MTEAESFSIGLDRVIQSYLRPYRSFSSEFPPGCGIVDTRRRSAETLQQWFVRLVDTCCDKDPARVAIEENIACFASLKWSEQRLLYASMPVLVASCELEEFYLADEHRDAVYLRLDVDYQTLGDPFSHPLAHVHVADDDRLRFALEGGTNGNVVMDYLEFVYRHFAPDQWLRWARRNWLSEREDEENVFEVIVQAFRDNQFAVLKEHTIQVQQLKRILRKAKDSFFTSQLDGIDREILEYPTAR